MSFAGPPKKTPTTVSKASVTYTTTIKPDIPKQGISPSKQEGTASKQEIVSKEEGVPTNEAIPKQVGNEALENAQNNDVAETSSDTTSGENSERPVADPSLKIQKKKSLAKKMIKCIFIISIFIGVVAVLWTCLFIEEENEKWQNQGLMGALKSKVSLFTYASARYGDNILTRAMPKQVADVFLEDPQINDEPDSFSETDEMEIEDWIIIILFFIGIGFLWKRFFASKRNQESKFTLFFHQQGLGGALTSRQLISNKDSSVAIKFISESVSGEKYAIIKYSNYQDLENIKNNIVPNSGEVFIEKTGVLAWILKTLTKYGKCLVGCVKAMITKIKAKVIHTNLK